MRLDIPAILTTDPPTPDWVIPGMVPRGTILMIAGDAGVGKSMLNYTIGLHVGLNRPVFGFPVVQTRVLYFDQENSLPDAATYLHRLWLGMDSPDPEEVAKVFAIEHFSLTAKWEDEMIRSVANFQPGLIIVDTATSALNVLQENDNSEAHRVISGLRRVMHSLDRQPAMIVLKHAKFESGGSQKGTIRRTIRGAKAWLSAVDQTLFHIKATAGRPRKDGMHRTILVRDKKRAHGLILPISIDPVILDEKTNSLILKGETFEPKHDLMIVSD